MCKKILVILAEYFPYPSSNINCIQPLLEMLKNSGFQIDIVTRRLSIPSPQQEDYHGINIYRINDCRTMNTICWQEHVKIPMPFMLKILNNLFMSLSKAFFYMRYYTTDKDKRYGAWSQKDVLHKCLELEKSEHYNAILSLSHPAKTHIIANEFSKKTNIPWIIYEMDPFCYNEAIYGKSAFKKYYKQQVNLFENCNRIILTPALYDFYKTTPLKCFLGKARTLELANLVPIENCKEIGLLPQKEGDKHIYCVFGGAIDATVRNPCYAINFISHANLDIKFIIMTGSKVDFLKKRIPENANKVMLYKRQTREVAYATMQQANILINIGNSVLFQVPGKIFEYMALGKPIVHFSKMEKDPCVPYLLKYPYALIIKEYRDNLEEQMQRFETFVLKSKDIEMNFEQVASNMPNLSGERIFSDFYETIKEVVED